MDLNERGKPKTPPERVAGQYNIYDSVPGMPKYSPLWIFNYVFEVLAVRIKRPSAIGTLEAERGAANPG